MPSSQVLFKTDTDTSEKSSNPSVHILCTSIEPDFTLGSYTKLADSLRRP